MLKYRQSLLEQSMYSLARRIHWTTDSEVDILDEVLSGRISTMEDVSNFFHSCHSLKNYPLTTNKINDIVWDYLDQDNLNIYSLYSLADCLQRRIKDKIIAICLSGKLPINWQTRYFLCEGSEYCLPLLKEYTRLYKQSGQHYHSSISCAFTGLRPEDLAAGCALLENTTPNVQSILLSRKDIEDKHILIGLKAISKLKNRKNINVKINLDMLKKLNPRGRLDAIKQIIGYTKRRRYYVYKTQNNFDPTPTKEELSELLFACSMQFTKEVSEVVAYYEQCLNHWSKEE